MSWPRRGDASRMLSTGVTDVGAFGTAYLVGLFPLVVAVVLALARVTGEVGAGAALAGEHDPEDLLGELAEVVRRAGREFGDTVRAAMLPTAGSA